MKISASKFYHEVTSSKTGGTSTILAAFRRWGVPIPENYRAKTEVFDIEHIPAAKKIYEQEQREQAGRRATRTARRPSDGVPPSHDSYFTTLDKIDRRLAGIESALNAILKIWAE